MSLIVQKFGGSSVADAERVFNVAGIIRLESPIIVRAPYVTIAGQTAPGDGVCIAGESFWVDTHDVVVRHMRFPSWKKRKYGIVMTLSEVTLLVI
mgnify:CR=1 FL=1